MQVLPVGFVLADVEPGDFSSRHSQYLTFPFSLSRFKVVAILTTQSLTVSEFVPPINEALSKIDEIVAGLDSRWWVIVALNPLFFWNRRYSAGRIVILLSRLFRTILSLFALGFFRVPGWLPNRTTLTFLSFVDRDDRNDTQDRFCLFVIILILMSTFGS